MKVAAIIPIKSRSTRIPNKNIKQLAGKPLLAYILETVKKVKGIDRVVVSTDSKKIAKLAAKYGAEVPFIRPKELTGDDTPTLPVLQHALMELKKIDDYTPDYVLLVYTTSPLLKKERIEQALKIASERGSDSVVSGTLDRGHYWIEVDGGWKRLYPLKQVNSQYQIPLCKENGAIYLTRAEVIKRQYAADKADVLIMDENENIDVDYPEDFNKVEEILRNKRSFSSNKNKQVK